MPYGYRRRSRRTYGRAPARGRRTYGGRSRFPRRTSRVRYGRRRRSVSPVARGYRRTARRTLYGRRRRTVRRSRPRTIRVVVQTVATSPIVLGDKGRQPTRAVF